MRAIGYRRAGGADVLEEIDTSAPVPGPRDLLVSVRAVAVNPADVKVRAYEQPTAPDAKILGWDVAGVVAAVGREVTLFTPGDEVFYAGAVDRPGANAELHAVDERLVAKKPKSLSFLEAAALPLTAITAWEILFERMRVARAPAGQDSPKTILVLAAAGGVGSILVQLARRLTPLTIIGTASRAESADFVRAMGAHHVVDHRRPLKETCGELGFPGVDYVAALTTTPENLPQIIEVLKPQGHVTFIDNPDIGVLPFKPKSLTVSLEMMFTRSLFQTDDMIEQHRLLTEVAALVDQGQVRTTLTERGGVLTATSLAAAHRRVESGTMLGKIALDGMTTREE